MHRFLLFNGSIHPTSAKLVSPGQVGYLNGWGVFSTIRVFDGVLFAFERHWARMRKDAAMLRVPMPADPARFQSELLSLVEANEAWNATLRVAVVRNRGGLFEGDGIERDFDIVAFTADVQRWGSGVRLAVQPGARHSACPFAGAKVTSWCSNLAWLEMARARGFDEVILLDEHGRVSECTSANIFVSNPEGVFTPPIDSGCLPGITRELLLGEASVAGLPVREKHLRISDLYEAESVFITSTTRELLPVFAIEDRDLKAPRNGARLRLQEAFSAYVHRYVESAAARGERAGSHRR